MGAEGGCTNTTKEATGTATMTTAIGTAAEQEGGWICRGEEREEGRDEAGPPRPKFDGEEEGHLYEGKWPPPFSQEGFGYFVGSE